MMELGDRRGSWDKPPGPVLIRLMRTGSAFWPLPAPMILYTNLGCGCAVDRSSGKRGCSVGFKRKPFCKAIRDGEPTS